MTTPNANNSSLPDTPTQPDSVRVHPAGSAPAGGGLVLLLWTCKCHGYTYRHPSCCLHTDARNLIPPPELRRGRQEPNAESSDRAGGASK